MKKIAILPFLLLVFVAKSQIKVSIDLLVKNAKIYTVNENFETAESMAILNGKILEIGKYDSIYFKYNPAKTLDLEGKVVLPGFIDAHTHFTGFALDKWKAELLGTKSWEEVLDRLKNYQKTTPTKWIYGRSWDQNDWEIKEFPTNEKLNQLFPKDPVFLKRIDGHAAIANNIALELAGITTETKIDGGEIEIKDGKLTGVLLDNAMNLVESLIPEIPDNLALNYIQSLQEECFSYGLTSVHDCGISEHMFSLLEKSQKKDQLKLKVYAFLNNNTETNETWINKGKFTNKNLTFAGYKVYTDGALGSRGAALLQDYSDKPDWKGFLLTDENQFRTLAQKLINTNLQMCAHAIGDAANRTVLNIYGEVLKEKNDRRWRVEHAQIVDKSDINLFGKYSIIPSVQPTHATSDMHWAETRLGNDRIKNAYAYQDLLKQNGWLPLGTDFPVEHMNPIQTFYAAVVRKDLENLPVEGFQKENALSKVQALKGMTIWAAKAGFEEEKKGSLEVGKWADFVILNQDLMTVSEDQILETKVLQTFINGESVYPFVQKEEQKK